MSRSLRRFLLSALRRIAVRLAPAPVRPYVLWTLGIPPVAGGDGGGGGGGGGDDDRKFTQADVDRIVQDRLQRDRKDRPSDDQVAEWKQKAEAHDEAARASQSDLEREQRAREDAEKERDDAKKRADEALESARETLRKSSIVAEAAKAGAIDPDEVHALLANKDFTVRKEDGTELKVTIGDDGQVTGTEDAIKEFLGQKKHLVGESRRPDWDGGTRKNPPEDQDDLASIDDPDKVLEHVSKL